MSRSSTTVSKVRVTPVPLTKPHPILMIGGTSKATARRAARFGLPMYTAAPVPEVEALYYEECARLGVQGFCIMPPAQSVHLFVVDDPDEAWATYGTPRLARGVDVRRMANVRHLVRGPLPCDERR